MAKYKLNDISTRAPKGADKQEIKEKTARIIADLQELQNLLFAEHKHAVLVVLQGMDASGKDGLVRKVFGELNPQGVGVTSFKVPTEEELSYDFLWRVHRHIPSKGSIQVFNRSYYEDILVTRVHGWCSDELAKSRMKAINDFEQLLQEHGNITILKFYLHVSAAEQQQRLEERMKDPAKMWKYNARDFEEAKMRDKYYEAYEDCFAHCNHPEWTIVPADQNWYKEYLVAKALKQALVSLQMAYPGMKQ